MERWNRSRRSLSSGQIVIPWQFRRRLKIAPKTKLAIYSRGDKLVVTKLKVPPLGEELKDLFRETDERHRGRK